MELGSGVSATVFSAQVPADFPGLPRSSDSSASRPVAIKAYMFGRDWRSNADSYFREKAFRKEVQAYLAIGSHPHIVQFYSAFRLVFDEETHEFIVDTIPPTKRNSHYHNNNHDNRKAAEKHHHNRSKECLLLTGVVMERLPLTLKEHIAWNRVETLDAPTIDALFHQIGSALVYLHREKHICHNDLKWDNIAMLSFGSKSLSLDTGRFQSRSQSPQFYFKLIDFGNARTYPTTEWTAAVKQSEKNLVLDSSNESVVSKNASTVKKDNITDFKATHQSKLPHLSFPNLLDWFHEHSANRPRRPMPLEQQQNQSIDNLKATAKKIKRSFKQGEYSTRVLTW